MIEAKMYNTGITFHLDLHGICAHDSLFQAYKDKALIFFEHAAPGFVGTINRKREFELGLFQMRIDANLGGILL